MAICLLATSGQSLASDNSREQLVIGVEELPPSPLPIGAPISTAMLYLHGFVGRSLTIYDPSWAVVCELCTTLPTLQNGQAKIVERADGSKGIDETFELAQGLSWDDGVPVSSADVVFSIEVVQSIGRGEVNLPNIKDVIALDNRRFTIRTNSVRFDYNGFQRLILIPAHIEEPIFRAAGSAEAYLARSAYKTDPTRRGLYDGPYRVKDFGAQSVVLVRNEYWSGHAPAFGEIILRCPSGDKSIAQDLLDGRIDMISGELGIGTEAAFSLQKTDKNSRFDFIFKTDLEYDHVDLNLRNPTLADVRVRRGLLMSLDRSKLFTPNRPADAREIPASFLPPTSPNYDPTLKLVHYDLQAADALFEDAGYRPGQDGIRTDAQGHRLSFRLMNASGDSPVVAALTEQWAKAGIEIVLDHRPFQETLSRREFDMAYYAWHNTPEFLIEPVYSAKGIPSPQNDYTGLNFPGLDDREMNHIAAAITTEMDPSQRLILWQRAQQIYAEKLPALPLAFVTNVFVVPNWLAGVVPTGHEIPTSFRVEDWHVR